MLFKERSKLAIKALVKQPPVTLEIALAQIIEIKEDSQSKNKKGRHDIQGFAHCSKVYIQIYPKR